MAAPLSGSPPYFLDKPSRAVLQLEGSGPNNNSQQSSHPHHVVAIPRRTELVVPDLGADRASRLAYDEERSKLSVQGEVTYPPGSGPWHAVFHSIYTLPAA
jgi:6-phosphogluconolactonase (cycloisomerase 2 family)